MDWVESLGIAAELLAGLEVSGDAALGRGLGQTVLLLARVGRSQSAAVLAAALGADPVFVNPDVAELSRRLEDELGTATWAVCVDEGRGMSVTETVAYAKAAISETLAALT